MHSLSATAIDRWLYLQASYNSMSHLFHSQQRGEDGDLRQVIENQYCSYSTSAGYEISFNTTIYIWLGFSYSNGVGALVGYG
jgi:hypothetical protein